MENLRDIVEIALFCFVNEWFVKHEQSQSVFPYTKKKGGKFEFAYFIGYYATV